ncbi:MAG: hypothetical protein E7598_07075 [Ruminococcaceae bacterium]|nr:hypothetical protein [Oscillospiraceae bacterium]
MKKITVVIFTDGTESKKYANQVCERFSKLSPEKEFCGIWGEIELNVEEVLCAIANTINHFIGNTNKTEIIFCCCKKDYNSIISKINTENCVVETLVYQDVKKEPWSV